MYKTSVAERCELHKWRNQLLILNFSSRAMLITYLIFIYIYICKDQI